jgi:hypothetical protein
LASNAFALEATPARSDRVTRTEAMVFMTRSPLRSWWSAHWRLALPVM